MDENKLSLVQKGKPTAAIRVVIRSRAYVTLMQAAAANLPSETVGALLGAVSPPEHTPRRVVVREVATIDLVPAGGLGLTMDLSAWEDLKERLTETGDESLQVVGWFYADPGSGIFRPRLQFGEVQQALADDVCLFLFVNPSTDQGVFYVIEDEGLAPAGGFFEAVDGNAAAVIPWNQEIRGGLEWLGVAPVAPSASRKQAKSTAARSAKSAAPPDTKPTGPPGRTSRDPVPEVRVRGGASATSATSAASATSPTSTTSATSVTTQPIPRVNGESPYLGPPPQSEGRRRIFGGGGRFPLTVFLLWQLLGLLLCGLGVSALQGRALFGTTNSPTPAPTATPAGFIYVQRWLDYSVHVTRQSPTIELVGAVLSGPAVRRPGTVSTIQTAQPLRAARVDAGFSGGLDPPSRE